MDLGDLELTILSLLRQRGEMTPSELHDLMARERQIAYTSVTSTLYRLKGKGLVASRRAAGGRVLYGARPLSKPGRETLSEIVGRLVDAFGESTVSHAVGTARKTTGPASDPAGGNRKGPRGKRSGRR